jgi:hypothetical protein
MKSWLQVGVAIAVLLTVTFITIHPNFDLLDSVLHNSHDLTFQGFMVLATPVKLDGLLIASLPAPEPDPVHQTRGPESLDLICVRLC